MKYILRYGNDGTEGSETTELVLEGDFVLCRENTGFGGDGWSALGPGDKLRNVNAERLGALYDDTGLVFLAVRDGPPKEPYG